MMSCSAGIPQRCILICIQIQPYPAAADRKAMLERLATLEVHHGVAPLGEGKHLLGCRKRHLPRQCGFQVSSRKLQHQCSRSMKFMCTRRRRARSAVSPGGAAKYFVRKLES